MIRRKIETHPSLNHAQDIKDICKPLQQLNISYFAHVHIDKAGTFSALGMNPEFVLHYLKHKYYNFDIHMAGTSLGNYILWDAIDPVGPSAKLYFESSEFGIHHTFTIIEQGPNGTDYYHFANNSNNKSINQIYIANIDLLKLFILHFNDKISQSKSLLRGYQFKFSIDEDSDGYTVNEDKNYIHTKINRGLFLNDMALQKNVTPHLQKLLTKRELEILAWLHYGKTAGDVATILGVADVTINKHIINIKAKTHSFTHFQLGEFFSTLFHHSDDFIHKFLKVKNK